MAQPSRASSGKASPGQVFAIVAVGVFVASLDLFIVNIAFPAIQRDFSGSSVSDVSWVLNSYAIVSAALLVPAGKLGDILGRRRVFVGGLLAFGAGSALCAAAPSLPFLIGARVLQGVGAAAVVPTSLGLLLPSISPAQRAVAIGGWAAIGAVGAALGPALGGLLTEIGWQWIFIVNVPLALITAVAAVRVLGEIRDQERPPLPDVVGTALLIAASGLLTLGLVQGPSWAWDLRVIGSFIGSAVLGAGFVWRSSRHPAPVLELSIVRVRAFALASLSAALFYAAFAAMLLSSVIFLTDVWGYSALEAGLALTPGPLAAAAFAPVSGRLASGFGPGRVGAVGALLFTLGNLWWIWRIGPEPDYVGEWLPAMVIGGIGVGLILPSFTIAATATLPPARLATGIGAQKLFMQIGATLGVSGFVAILGTPAPDQVLGAFDETWVFMVIVTVAAALALMPLRRPTKVASDEQGSPADGAKARVAGAPAG